MGQVHWSVAVSSDLDQALRRFLTERGDMAESEFSRFVEEAVQARLFELTVEQIKERNRLVSQDEIMAAIDEALGSQSE